MRESVRPGPSPIVSSVYVLAAVPASRPCCITPTNSPPMMLMNMIRMPATASPRTNLEAPSMEPKKSASSAMVARRFLASSSPIRPAFRSASMAICLPGMASSVKRAATSATRPAPLVITTKLMMTRIAKTTIPTAKLPPTRKCPKASITCPAEPGPACPSSKTTRVDATLSDKRSNVVISKTVGKTEKSSGFITLIATSMTMIEIAMLKVKKRSSMNGGSGSTIIDRMSRMRKGPANCLAPPRPKRF